MARRTKAPKAPRTPKAPVAVIAGAPRPPSMRQRIAMHADDVTRSLMQQHPLAQKMRQDMANAIQSVVRRNSGLSARGPAARGRQRSLFE